MMSLQADLARRSNGEAIAAVIGRPLLSGVHMNIFVGNLARDVTEEDLLTAFGAYGRVARATVLKDKFSGEPRGFGFVEMEAKNEAQAAISGLNGSELKGRALNVNEARPKTERSRGPGGGGGGGGGNGGGGRSGWGNKPRGGGGGRW
jgi:RNA recognition motif-containing protein